MGEGKRRQLAMRAYSAMAAGPGELNLAEPNVVIVSRAVAEDMGALCAAAETLIGKQSLVRLIRSFDSKSMKQAEWVIASGVDGGPGNVHMIRRTEEALEMAFRMVADGMAERGLDWTAIVLGSDSDRAEVRELAMQYAERLRNRPKDKPRPVIAVSQEAEPKMLLEISREEVERRDLRNTLMGLDVMVSSSQFVDRFRNRLTLSFSGYDDDPRHIAEIEGTRDYLSLVAGYAPWAPLLSHKSMYMSWCAALDSRCVVTSNENGMTKMHVPPEAAPAIMRLLQYTAAEVNVHHLGLSDLHPALQAAIMSWGAFLTDGSDEFDAMEDGLSFGLPPSEVNSWMRNQKKEGNQQVEQRKEMPAAGPAEKQFWDSTVGLANPGWVVDVSKDHVGQGLTSQEVVIYVVDTASGVVFAGGFPQRDVMKVVETAREHDAGESMISFAIQTIRRLGEEGVTDTKSQDARAAIFASIAALSSMALFRAVQEQTGALKGHWIYMVYQPKSGDPIARSTYAQRDSAGIFSLPELYETCAEVIEGDLRKPGNVNSWIRKSGGLQLCGLLRDQVGE